MTPEQEKKLDEALKLSQDNNKILLKMKRSLMWSRVVRTIYILIILGVTFGSYYFIQPYLDNVLGAYSSLLGTKESVQQVGNSLPDVGKLLENFTN